MKRFKPIKFKFKVEYEPDVIRFIDNDGVSDFDCIRYVYFKKDGSLIYYYPERYDKVREIISEEVLHNVEEAVYKHYSTISL